MARQAVLRTIRCYHCASEFEVGAKALTVSCPCCYRRVVIEDMLVRHSHSGGRVQTCGRIVVAERGRFTAMTVEASGGLEIDGVFNAQRVTSDSVRLGSASRFRGDCSARSIRIEPGARIDGGYFRVGAFAADARASDNPAGSDAA